MHNVNNLRNMILEEADGSRNSIYRGSTKIYHDRIEVFWLDVLKRDIEEFFARCPAECLIPRSEISHFEVERH